MALTFEPIDLDRRQAYQERLTACPQQASDYSFINIWGWAEEYGLEWAWSDQLVWIRQARPTRCLWAPIGPWHAVDWNRIWDQSLRTGERFQRIPESLIQLWDQYLERPKAITEDRDQWDYLHGYRDLVRLKGNRFHKKKNLVNRFKRQVDSQLVPFDRNVVDQALAMQADWCEWRDCESSRSLSSENRVVQKVLQHWESLDSQLFGGALLVAGSLVAYTLAEYLTEKMVVIHFEKGASQYQGVYQAINQIFLESLKDDAPEIVNRGQDLGDAGLRKAKLSYHPQDYVRKYVMVW